MVAVIIEEIVTKEWEPVVKDLRQNRVNAVIIPYRKNVSAEEEPFFPSGIVPAQVENRDTLIVTDWEEVCKLAIQEGYGVIAYLHSGNANQKFVDTAYAISDTRGLDYEYFKRVYQRLKGIPWIILRTKRCTVREITVADVDALYRIYRDPSITKYIEKLYEDKEEELQYTRDYIKNIYGYYEYGMWIVEETATGEVIGRAGLEYKEDQMGLELGYMIAADRQKKGYAYEVCHAILNYAKNILQEKIIYAYTKKENKASVKLLKKLEFTYVNEHMVSKESYLKYVNKIK